MMTWRLRLAAMVSLGAILAVCVVLPIVVLAATAGPEYAGEGNGLTPSGDASWIDTSNAAGSSTITASTVYLLEAESSNTLVTSDYGFSLPVGANITSITARIYCKRGSEGGRPEDLLIQLYTSAGLFSTNKAVATYWSSTAGERTYIWSAGGDTMPSVTEINATTFGVAIRVVENYTGDPVTAYVYYVSVEIEYLPSGGGGGPGAGGNATNAFWFEP